MIISCFIILQPPGKRPDPAEAELLPHFDRDQEAARAARHDEADGDAEQGLQVPLETGGGGLHSSQRLSGCICIHLQGGAGGRGTGFG